jgi:hypothetical protein
MVLEQIEPPLLQAVMEEIRTDKIDELYDCVQKTGAPIFLPIEEKRYRMNDTLLVNRQFIVLDPDDYMLRFSQNITEIKTSI